MLVQLTWEDIIRGVQKENFVLTVPIERAVKRALTKYNVVDNSLRHQISSFVTQFAGPFTEPAVFEVPLPVCFNKKIDMEEYCDPD